MEKPLEFRKDARMALPYLYFTGLAAFWFIQEWAVLQHVSYIALGMMLILLIQAVLQNKLFGTSLGIVAIAVHVLGFLAVLSEFNDFEVISTSAIQLLAVGSLLTLSGLAMGVFLTAANVRPLQ